MKRMYYNVHPDVNLTRGKLIKRIAARAIVMKGRSILLMYTKRYNDYSLPGGGVDADEPIEDGLIRELEEETGATDIKIKRIYGYTEEFRPYYRSKNDCMHMISYLYTCTIGEHFKPAALETYEVKNGMTAIWIDIDEAIAHNRRVMQSRDEHLGLSIERETIVLEDIAKNELI